MRRVLPALLFIAILACFLWGGTFGVVLLPFMLVVVVLVAVPILVVFVRMNWLRWWHALMAGSLCGTVYPVVDYLATPGVDLDRILSANSLLFVGIGAAIGIAVWCFGVFRNPAFPSVPTVLPRSLVLIVPLAASGYYLHEAIAIKQPLGRVLAVLDDTNDARAVGHASVRLSEGPTVVVEIRTEWRGKVAQGQCFHLVETWSWLRWQRNYELNVPFEDEGHDC